MKYCPDPSDFSEVGASVAITAHVGAGYMYPPQPWDRCSIPLHSPSSNHPLTTLIIIYPRHAELKCRKDAVRSFFLPLLWCMLTSAASCEFAAYCNSRSNTLVLVRFGSLSLNLHCVDLNHIALLYWDYALTLRHEIKYLWSKKRWRKLSTVFYIFCRYALPANVLYLLTVTGKLGSSCGNWYKFIGAISVLGRAAVLGTIAPVRLRMREH